MVEYGGDVGVGSMMALMTEHQPESESIMTSIPIPSSYSSYSHGHGHGHGHGHAHGQSECLLSAAAMFQTSRPCQGANKFDPANAHIGGGGGAGHFVMEQFIPEQAVISDSSISSVKTEVCSGSGGTGVPGQFELIRRKEEGRCARAYPEPSFVVTPLVTSVPPPQQEGRMVTSLAVDMDSSCSCKPNEADAMKSKIIAHVHYPRLVAAYIDCQKVGAPPDVVSELDELSQKCQAQHCVATISIGADPELDQFMEAYCEMFIKYQEELTKPFKEAMAFLKKIENQLGSLTKGTIRTSSLDQGDERGDGAVSSEEEDGSGGEVEFHEVDPHAEDRELKDQLLRKYSGYLSSLKQEFLKKKKKGKLPKEARQKLLEWWTRNYKWPYPSESQKIQLAESTGLDQKQINNWFINQRKRHWKPSEEMQFVVMDSPNPHNAAFYLEGHLRADGSAFSMDC